MKIDKYIPDYKQTLEQSRRESLESQIQENLPSPIKEISLKGSGSCNDAYYIVTEDDKKYLVKLEKEVKEFTPENTLVVEAKVAQALEALDLDTPIPHVTFVSENPDMYGYEYIEGDLLRGAWNDFTHDEKITIFKSLGKFHADIAREISKEKAEAIGVQINLSADLHPENLEEHEEIFKNDSVPQNFKDLLIRAKEIVDSTEDKAVFHFLHGDAHHENIIVQDKKVSGFIDFGNSEYGEVSKEFSRYIRDFPDYFQYIVSEYEKVSGDDLSHERLIAFSCASGFIDVVEMYLEGGEEKEKAEESVRVYEELLP
jgi:aminoglycoside phosphotransferase (APT) family kinase protein